MEICVKFFGAFRQFGSEAVVEIPDGATVREVKQALAGQVGNQSLVNESALANDQEILREHHVLQNGQILSILPPVCGG